MNNKKKKIKRWLVITGWHSIRRNMLTMESKSNRSIDMRSTQFLQCLSIKAKQIAFT